MKCKVFSGNGCFGGNAAPEPAQGVQRIIQDYVFFNVVGGNYKEFFHPGEDGILCLLNSPGNLIAVCFEQGRLIKRIPGKAGLSAGH